MCFNVLWKLCFEMGRKDYEPLETSDSIEWEQCSSVDSEE